MTWGQVLMFAGVVVLGAIAPGPDFAVVVRRAVGDGRRAGMAAGAGVAAGVFLWALAAAAGLAAAMTALPQVLTVIRYAGGAYLTYLGIRGLLAALRRPAAATEPIAVRDTGWWAPFRDGFLCNVLNPKAAVFFVALLPQFLPADPRPVDTLVLALVAVGITLAWFGTVATLIAAMRRLFARPAVRRAVDAVTGTALLGLGARLALTGAR